MLFRSQTQLKTLQPDVYEWIHKKYVSFEDVPYMTGFPLDPIIHLHGDVSSLVQHRYPCDLLRSLGYTYEWLKDVKHMNREWMKMFNFTVREWMSLGLTMQHVRDGMTEADTKHIFGATKEALFINMAWKHT